MTSLESARLKLARALEHLKAIERCIRRYAARNPYKVITESDGKETLHIAEHPPDTIAILAGEMVYQLRSALDHLAFDLVKANQTSTTLPTDWEENCCFPLWTKNPKKPPAYNCFNSSLPGITKAAFAFIESVQPYHRLGTANALRLLAKLSNVDKHRHLNVTVPQVVHREVLTTIHGTISVARGGLKHGAEIEPRVPPQPYPTVDLKRSLASYVTFDEPTVGQASTLEVQHVLHVCLEQVQTTIIPMFDQILNNP
jgi:hypothetical protein